MRINFLLVLSIASLLLLVSTGIVLAEIVKVTNHGAWLESQRSIIRTSNNELVVFYHEGNWIKYRISKDEGKSWSLPKYLAEVYVRDETGKKYWARAIFSATIDSADNIYVVYASGSSRPSGAGGIFHANLWVIKGKYKAGDWLWSPPKLIDRIFGWSAAFFTSVDIELDSKGYLHVLSLESHSLNELKTSVRYYKLDSTTLKLLTYNELYSNRKLGDMYWLLGSVCILVDNKRDLIYAIYQLEDVQQKGVYSIFYRVNSGKGWSSPYPIADKWEAGKEVSASLDNKGNLHVAYIVSGSGKYYLKYALYKPSSSKPIVKKLLFSPEGPLTNTVLSTSGENVYIFVSAYDSTARQSELILFKNENKDWSQRVIYTTKASFYELSALRVAKSGYLDYTFQLSTRELYYGKLPLSISVTFRLVGVDFLQAVVDGKLDTWSSTKTYKWTPGSAHSIKLPPVVSISKYERAILLKWGDGYNSSFRTFITPPADKMLTIYYARQYYLHVENGSGSGWYTKDKIVALKTPHIIRESGNTRFNLVSYTIDGETHNIKRTAYGSFSLYVKMDKPHRVTWNYVKQALVSVNSTIKGVSINMDKSPTADSWYDVNSSISVSVKSILTFDKTARYVFKKWLLSGEGLLEKATDPSTRLLVKGPVSVTASWSYDKIVVSDYKVSDSRCDVGTEQKISLRFKWQSDGKPLDEGWRVDINGTTYYTNATGWISFTATSWEVGKKKFYVTFANNGTNFIQRDPVSIIWDKLEVRLHVKKARVNVGESVVIYVNITRLYDNSSVAEFIVDINRNDTLWLSGYRSSSFTDVEFNPTKRVYTIAEVLDVKYGLTSFLSNKVEVVWDRLIVKLTPLRERVDVGSSALISITVTRQYDNSPVKNFSAIISTNMGSLLRSKNGTIWDVAYEPSSRIYSCEYVIDQEYGITAFLSNTVKVIWDRVKIKYEIDRTRGDLNYSPEIKVYAFYEYDNKSFHGRIFLNGEEMNYDERIGAWLLKWPPAGRLSIGIFNVSSIIDLKYGLKTFKAVNEAPVFIWDRIKIEKLWSERQRALLNEEITLYAIAVYEYDNTPFTEGVLNLNNGISMTYKNGVWSASVSSSELGEKLYWVTEAYDERYGIRTVLCDVTANITWDNIKTFVEVRAANSTSTYYVMPSDPVDIIVRLGYEYNNEPAQGYIVRLFDARGYLLQETKTDKYGVAVFKYSLSDENRKVIIKIYSPSGDELLHQFSKTMPVSYMRLEDIKVSGSIFNPYVYFKLSAYNKTVLEYYATLYIVKKGKGGYTLPVNVTTNGFKILQFTVNNTGVWYGDPLEVSLLVENTRGVSEFFEATINVKVPWSQEPINSWIISGEIPPLNAKNLSITAHFSNGKLPAREYPLIFEIVVGNDTVHNGALPILLTRDDVRVEEIYPLGYLSDSVYESILEGVVMPKNSGIVLRAVDRSLVTLLPSGPIFAALPSDISIHISATLNKEIIEVSDTLDVTISIWNNMDKDIPVYVSLSDGFTDIRSSLITILAGKNVTLSLSFPVEPYSEPYSLVNRTLIVRACLPNSEVIGETVLTYLIANYGPYVKLISPREGEKLTGNVVFKFKVEDLSGVREVKYKWDNEPEWRTLTNETFAYDTRKLPDGKHVLRISASDIHGFTTERNYWFMIENSKYQLLTPVNLALLISLVSAITVVLIIILKKSLMLKVKS